MASWILDLGMQRVIADSRIAIIPQYSLQFAREHHKPYFGRQLSAFQSPPVRYALLADLARYALRGRSAVRILEIGSWAGASAITFGTVVRELQIPVRRIICIDQWSKYFVDEDSSLHYRSMNAAATTREIQKLFQHNVQVCGLEEMIQVRNANSREVLPELESAAFDLVYIDGSHKKDDVLYDLEQAKRLVRNGAMICGDDLELLKSEIDSDAHQLALGKDTDFVVDPRTGASYHPGVTEAIATVFNDVWQEHGLWCVKRSGELWSIPDFQVSNLEIPTHLQHAVEIPYGLFNGYELFRQGDGFVAYPMASPHWFQNRIVCSSIEELALLLDAIERIDQARAPRIVESRDSFNIVSYKGRYWAISKSLGPTELFRERLGERDLAPLLFSADTLDEVKAKVHQLAPPVSESPCLLETYQGYNLVEYEGIVWIVAIAAGPVDLTNLETKRALLSQGRLMCAATIEGARLAVERRSREGQTS
ncbi:MAG: class I SAM-dependent methyltransferase [Nitrospira sp.]|nr:class I SAM-dependent methyltransferase [Nitrospira sp.]